MAHPEFEALDALLVAGFGLVPERAHGGSWRTYFHERVEWHPARSTRLLKVLLDHAGRPARIQLCVSSDPNNSVFLAPPFTREALRAAVDAEAARLRAVVAAIRPASNP